MELPVNLIMGIVLAFGIILSIFSFQLSSQTESCTDQTVRRAVNGCLVLSTMLIAVPITFMLCGCGGDNTLKISTILGLFFALSMTIIVLSSMVHNRAGNSGCMAARSTTPTMITISVIIAVICLGYFGWKMYGAMGNKTAFG